MTEITPPRYQTYGRRRSRTWSSEHEDRLAHDVNCHGLDLSHLNPLSSQPLQDLFTSPVTEVWLEIGFGYGEHMVGVAHHHPHIGIIGAEVYLSGVVAALESIAEYELQNIKVFPHDGRELLDQLPAKSLDRIALLFPDPWPKARHEKRQFFSDSFISHLKRLLKPKGIFRFGSDALGYVEKVQKTFEVDQDFSLIAHSRSPERPDPREWPISRYEQKARNQGRICTYLEYLLAPGQKSEDIHKS